MEKNKEKKKTLTISSGFKKKLMQAHFKEKREKNLFQYQMIKKELFKGTKNFNRTPLPDQQFKKNEGRNKKFTRKFVEQQATKAFIKKDDKPSGKSKLKLKTPIDKRDFKLTVSRALNVEEIEIKQRSLAAVKRARLKEKKNGPEIEEKKSIKKLLEKSKFLNK